VHYVPNGCSYAATHSHAHFIADGIAHFVAIGVAH